MDEWSESKWQEFANKCGTICYRHYDNLPKSGKPILGKEWTPLAAVVKVSGTIQQESVFGDKYLEVVSLGCGSKCVGISKLSTCGSVVSDSHAEVLARRAFLVYLYDQMMDVVQGQSSDVFTFDKKENKFELKPGISFHFFCSEVPCGDASIFKKLDIMEEPPLKKLRRTNREENVGSVFLETGERPHVDINRTGAKCVPGEPGDPLLPGVDYHVTGVLRTKPGRGDRSLSMSCSDKLAKWNIVGVQGALLALILHSPIYLSSIIIGSANYDRNSLHRAIIGRIKEQYPYKISDPRLLHCEIPFCNSRSSTLNPSPSCMVWSRGTKHRYDVIVNGLKLGTTKKSRGTEKCQTFVCKLRLFKLFLQLTQEMNNPSKQLRDLEGESYRKVKDRSESYQEIWNSLRRTVFKLWTQKPVNLTEFS